MTQRRDAVYEQEDQDPSNETTQPFKRLKSSNHRGVTKHRWTGRFEAHLWDSSAAKKKGQRGRQVYLGGYTDEDVAARAYDRAALKYWGTSTPLNFPMENYRKDIEKMESLSKAEVVSLIRRESTGFSRGASKFRGVTRHHKLGKWQARISKAGKMKPMYLGTFETQEAAARCYDLAAMKYHGDKALLNFPRTSYEDEVKEEEPEQEEEQEQWQEDQHQQLQQQQHQQQHHQQQQQHHQQQQQQHQQQHHHEHYYQNQHQHLHQNQLQPQQNQNQQQQHHHQNQNQQQQNQQQQQQQHWGELPRQQPLFVHPAYPQEFYPHLLNDPYHQQLDYHYGQDYQQDLDLLPDLQEQKESNSVQLGWK